MQLLVKTPQQIGEILRARRKASGITQFDLAAKLGVTQGRLSVLEGDPSSLSLSRLLAAANFLGIEVVLRDKCDAEGSESESPPPAW